MNIFLKKTELLDAFEEKEATTLFAGDPSVDEHIGFRDVTFSWAKQSDGSFTRSRQFQLKIDGDLLFPQGRISLIIGPTGSGSSGPPTLQLDVHLPQGKLRFPWRFWARCTGFRRRRSLGFVPVRLGAGPRSVSSWGPNGGRGERFNPVGRSKSAPDARQSRLLNSGHFAA
ncbi:hypothetical protein K438DRAFT_834943 [Mycena galopus ATCC 62051]|nr:hypothetical protein K438DRAFT_834943 [Mycena galopus ATCC 62051]